MRHYETIYILKPDLSDEEHKSALEKFNELIEKQKGVVVRTEEWGKQRLAYEIKKTDYGHYILLNYCATQGLIRELERILKMDERVLKYQTVKLADKADAEELLAKEEEAKRVKAQKETPPPVREDVPPAAETTPETTPTVEEKNAV
ncbi:30S ribosomal protein S6 [Thermodesulfobacteriota bacterium]